VLRALAGLYLDHKTRRSRSALAKHVAEELARLKCRYHERTIRRYINGTPSTVPAVVETAIRRVVAEALRLGDDRALDHALKHAGLAVSKSQDEPRLASTRRLVPLTDLWLYFHPGRTKRSLARQLSRDLQQRGIWVSPEALQSQLVAKTHKSVRREVVDQMISYLGEFGIDSELRANSFWTTHHEEIERALAGRKQMDADSAKDLALVWQLHNRGASHRSLAAVVRDRLARHGISASIDRLQDLLSGRQARTQRRVLEALAWVVSAQLPKRTTLAEALADVRSRVQLRDDFHWVSARPIVQMGRRLTATGPWRSQRQLAAAVARVVNELGYQIHPHTVLVLLLGARKKARGYVWRALQTVDE
jgi:hypothetical protein